jgi:hypothetical protein
MITNFWQTQSNTQIVTYLSSLISDTNLSVEEKSDKITKLFMAIIPENRLEELIAVGEQVLNDMNTIKEAADEKTKGCFKS